MTFEENLDEITQTYQEATEQVMQAELDRLKAAGLTDDEATQMTGVKYVKWLKKQEALQS